MPENILKLRSISQLHQLLGQAKPKHPLISLIDGSSFYIPAEYVGTKVLNELYMISIKDKDCGAAYGRNSFDFGEGVMVFTAPKQASTAKQEVVPGEINGWMLYFHPDLIRGTHLWEAMSEYTFFNYEVYEALHLSESEENTIWEIVQNIKEEYEQRIDNHSQRVIVSNLELLLNYALRFYERQFNTRTSKNKDVIIQFEKSLKTYFQSGLHGENGLPTIQYFADQVHLSPHYFSDLLRKETGRSAKDHINEYIIDQAKNRLLGSQQSISEIAYDLGFNYPHYFTRLFKSKTGTTPLEYRSMN